MRHRLGDLLAAVVLIALILACFGRLAARPTALIVDGERSSVDNAVVGDPRPIGNDLTFLFLPHFNHVANELARHGRLPFWDASGFAGRPMVGNPQSGLFYPPVWIAWVWRSPAALGWLTVGHLVWAAFGGYALGRTLGLSRVAATVAGGVFAASPYLLAHTFEGHYPHVWAVAWYSWAFWAYVECRNGRLRGTWALPVILALAFLAGHPQEWYYLTFLLSVLTVCDALWSAVRGNRWLAVGRLMVWAAVVGLSFGLIAVEIVPEVAAQPGTLSSGGLAFYQVSRYSPHSVNFLQLLSPTALGGPADYIGHENYWEPLIAIGLVPLVLALIAFGGHPEKVRVRTWWLLTCVLVVFSVGRKAGLFILLYLTVPGMNRFRTPSRAMFLVALAGAVLAGHGIDTFRRSFVTQVEWTVFNRRYLGFSACLVAVLLVGQALLWATEPFEAERPVKSTIEVRETNTKAEGRRETIVEKVVPKALTVAAEPEPARACFAAARIVHNPAFWLALGGTVAAIAYASRGPNQRERAAYALGALALCELGWYGHDLIRVAPAERFVGPDPISTALRRAQTPGASPSRIRARDALYGDLPAHVHGFEKININDWYQLQRSADLYQTLYTLFDPVIPAVPDDPMLDETRRFGTEIRQAVLDRMAIGWLVTDGAELPLSGPLEAAGAWRGRPFTIYRNPTALPRAYVVPRAYPASDYAPRELALFHLVDPRAAVLMTRDPLAPDAARQPFTPAEWVGDDPDRVVVRVTTEAAGLLVIADTWAPGWTAEVDGLPAKILRGNHAQRVIALKRPGHHEIVMRFQPPGFRLGLAVTGLSLLVWAASLAIALHRRAWRSVQMTRVTNAPHFVVFAEKCVSV